MNERKKPEEVEWPDPRPDPEEEPTEPWARRTPKEEKDDADS
jgi:hypothetical protein